MAPLILPFLDFVVKLGEAGLGAGHFHAVQGSGSDPIELASMVKKMVS
jgi:hypothetical protein